MKSCLKCHDFINENKDKYCMIITKLGNRVVEFECFHFGCWKRFFRECGGIEKDKNL